MGLGIHTIMNMAKESKEGALNKLDENDGAPFSITKAHLPQSVNRPNRVRAPKGVVIHTTGRGLLASAQKIGGPLGQAAVKWYKNTQFSYFGAYLIDHEGNVFELAPLNKLTFHSADIKGTTLPWWHARWPSFKSPIDLLGTTHINSYTVGIDLLPTSNATYTDKQHIALRNLIRYLANKYGFPISRQTILGHEDVDPVARSTTDKKSGWDPGPSLNWEAIL